MLVFEIMAQINRIAEIEQGLAKVREYSESEDVNIDDGIIDIGDVHINISEIIMFLREYKECLETREVK